MKVILLFVMMLSFVSVTHAQKPAKEFRIELGKEKVLIQVFKYNNPNTADWSNHYIIESDAPLQIEYRKNTKEPVIDVMGRKLVAEYVPRESDKDEDKVNVVIDSKPNWSAACLYFASIETTRKKILINGTETVLEEGVNDFETEMRIPFKIVYKNFKN